MKNGNNLPLGQKFPRLSFAKYADFFLAGCKAENIKHQFSVRHIGHVSIEPTIPDEIGLKICSDGLFNINVDANHHLFDQAQSFGYKVAQTFLYDLKKNPPEKLHFQNMKREIESFCREFRDRWLDAVSTAAVIEYLVNTVGETKQTELCHIHD